MSKKELFERMRETSFGGDDEPKRQKKDEVWEVYWEEIRKEEEKKERAKWQHEVRRIR